MSRKRILLYLGAIVMGIYQSGNVLGQINNPEGGFVFDDHSVPRIDITISEPDLEALYSDPFSDVEQRIHFKFTRDGIIAEMADVGFRFRGNTSRNNIKKAFKISFNSFQPGRNFFGLEKMNLNAETNDPSMLRSKLSWELFRYLGVPASRLNHVRLYINGENYGVYINTEHIDERFANSRFGNNEGNLYKCLWPADLTYLGTDEDNYKFDNNGRKAYELHTNSEWDDYEDLMNLIIAINQTVPEKYPENVEKEFNVQQYLKVMAVDVMTGNWDGYIGNMNNFYLYRDSETGRFEYIPYDLDNTYGIDWLGVDWSNRSIYNWDRDERPLYEKILQLDKYKSQYTGYIRLLADYMASDEFNQEMERLKSQISSWVNQDPLYSLDRGYTYDDFNNALTVAAGGHVQYSILDYISRRISSAMEEAVETDAPPVISYVFVEPLQDSIIVTWVAEDDDPDFSTTLNYSINGGEWQSVQFITSSDTLPVSGLFVFKDTIYGQSGEYSVNIYIEANDTGGQSSRYPADNFEIAYPLWSGPLYINEFMASNVDYMADEYGEYDDWVEIYNQSDFPVWLGNIYMSDDNGNPGKYRFPDDYIYPHDHLRIWLDGQPEQGEFHASFKIKKSGELLRLSERPSTGYRIIDLVKFGGQQPDVSYGREDDGGDYWMAFAQPTPGFSNVSVGNSNIAIDERFTVYPNPAHSNHLFFNKLVTGAIYDVSGRIISEIINQSDSDISGLSPGIFIIRLNSGEAAQLIIE